MRYKSLVGFAICEITRYTFGAICAWRHEKKGFYRTTLPLGNISHRQVYRICESKYIAFCSANISLSYSGQSKGIFTRVHFCVRCVGKVVEVFQICVLKDLFGLCYARQFLYKSYFFLKNTCCFSCVVVYCNSNN